MAGIMGALSNFLGGGGGPVPHGTPPQPESQYGKLKKMPEEKSREFASDLHQKVSRGIAACKPRKQEMYEADKFWNAEHWDDVGNPWDPKPIENWVFATVEQHFANLSTGNIRPIIMGQDPGDEKDAEKFTLAVNHLWQPNKLNLDYVVDRAIHGSQLKGTACVKVYFDPTKNGGRAFTDKMGKPAPRQMTNPMDGTPYSIYSTQTKGEICVEQVDPANIIPDPSGYSLGGVGACEWIAIRMPKNRKWIENNPRYQEYVGKAKLKQLLEEVGDGGSGRADTEFYHDRPINTKHGDDIIHDEVWIRRLDEFGNWHIDYAEKIGDRLIYYVESLYQDGEFPFAILYDYEVDKSFFGMGEPKQTIPNQKTINQVNRLVATNAGLMSNTQKIVTNASGIDLDDVVKYGTMPGMAWKSNTPDGIKPIDVKEIPVSIFKVGESAREGLRTIMAMDEANMGQFGGSVTAASGIKMIQDKANVRDTAKGKNVVRFVARMTQLIVSRMQQFYTTERYIPLYDSSARTNGQFVPFTGSDYQDMSLSVVIDAGAGSPLNQQSMEEKAWKMWENQGTMQYDPPLITIEELLATIQGFPAKERMLKRIREANSMKQVQQAIQLGQIMAQLMMSGVDPSTIPPEQLMQLQQQVAAQPQQPAGVPHGTPPIPPQV